MHKRHITALRIMTVALFFLAIDPVFGQQPSPPRAATTARVEYVEGDVRIDGAPAQFGQMVSFGSLVQTAADGFVEVTFEDGNILRVEADSVVRLSLNSEIRRVDLRSGQVAIVAEGLRRANVLGGQRLILRTPSAVAGVRGTLFFARVESATSTYICTCYGELAIDGEGFDAFSVRSARHGARRITAGSDGRATVSVAELLYHTDEDMEQLAEKVGVEVDWGNEPRVY